MKKKPKPETGLTAEELQEVKDLEKLIEAEEPTDLRPTDKPQDTWSGQWDAPKDG